MFRKTMIMLMTAALGFSGTVLAGEIYKWTDDDGNVHYEDRPTGAQVERLAVASRSTDNASVQASIDARREHETARSDARSKSAEDAKAAADEQMETDQRTAKCQASRSRMESYLQARRLYNQDDSGARVYLDESQIMEARSKAQDEIQKYCD
jgi:hypothetical protein